MSIRVCQMVQTINMTMAFWMPSANIIYNFKQNSISNFFLRQRQTTSACVYLLRKKKPDSYTDLYFPNQNSINLYSFDIKKSLVSSTNGSMKTVIYVSVACGKKIHGKSSIWISKQSIFIVVFHRTSNDWERYSQFFFGLIR